jgi:putative FmdB family regulatory protein
MPVYTYRCTKCGEEFMAPRPIAQRDAPVFCPCCNMLAQRQLDAPMGVVKGPAVPKGSA